jgi:hypothetical protein
MNGMILSANLQPALDISNIQMIDVECIPSIIHEQSDGKMGWQKRRGERRGKAYSIGLRLLTNTVSLHDCRHDCI